ncbi:MAG: D-aminoacyl-tRNA deacylase [Candidatus Caldarchaeum sp.]
MKAVIMMSSEDIAAANILKTLKENFGFVEDASPNVYRGKEVEAVVVNESMLHADKAVASVNADLIVVASKHVSEAGRRCILVHSTGNWGEKADYGGRPWTLSMTSAEAVYRAVHACLQAVENAGLTNVEVGLEATHHGPYSEKPLIFVEVGSSPESWRDLEMAEAAAEACVKICGQKSGKPTVNAVGFGGGHYARDIFKTVLKGDAAVGHIASKHHFPLPEKLISQAFDKTLETPRTALVDWDGLRAEHRYNLLKELERLGVEVIKV